MRTKQTYIGIIAALLFSVCSVLSAQELNCNVQINSDQIEGSNKQIFSTLQQSISEFVNQSKWTNLTFQQQEKIDCSIFLIVKAVNEDVFTCEATIQASRPVYGSSYTTTLLNMRDNSFNFTYQEFDQLTYQQTTFQSNLTALLAYYVYLILGYDADSYQRLGGTPYFQACEQIVSVCQTSSLSDLEMSGWKVFSAGQSSRNRYTMVNNLMDEAFKPFRLFYYEYHRLGLDEMSGNVANARARIAEGMKVVKEVNKNRYNNYVVGPFLDAKADELSNIFNGGTTEEKESIYGLLMDMDPTRSQVYDRILE